MASKHRSIRHQKEWFWSRPIFRSIEYYCCIFYYCTISKNLFGGYQNISVGGHRMFRLSSWLLNPILSVAIHKRSIAIEIGGHDMPRLQTVGNEQFIGAQLSQRILSRLLATNKYFHLSKPTLKVICPWPSYRMALEAHLNERYRRIYYFIIMCYILNITAVNLMITRLESCQRLLKTVILLCAIIMLTTMIRNSLLWINFHQKFTKLSSFCKNF